MADTIKDLDMFPYFHAANFIQRSNAIRNDSDPPEFSREHPFASYISTMVACFSQKMLANALIGEPIVDPWQDFGMVLMATVMWYLVNFSPFDLFYNLTDTMPVTIILGIMCEIFRANQIYEGVDVAFNKYSESPLIILSIGTISGNGIKFILLLHRLIRGLWTPEEVEFMVPNYDTRASFVASLIFWMYHNDMSSTLYLMVVLFLLSMKAMTLWSFNPFDMIEDLFYKMTIGLWDTISHLLRRKHVEMPVVEVTLDVSAEIPPVPEVPVVPAPDIVSGIASSVKPKRRSPNRSRSRKGRSRSRSCSSRRR